MKGRSHFLLNRNLMLFVRSFLVLLFSLISAVTSVIINVDQDVDEDWVLEVYGHDGKATNVTMKPGDMVLYESHSGE